jgi:hypothetical protein
MPDFQEIENEAKGHSKQVDEGVDKLDQEADKESDGKDRGLIDKGAQEVEKELGSGPDDAKPDSTSPI